MRIGYLLPGFSADENDQAIPVQDALVRELAQRCDLQIIPLRYPHHQTYYNWHGIGVYPLNGGTARGWRRLQLWRRAMRAVTELHRQQPFDLLHATWADETGLIAARTARKLGIPSVVSVVGGELVGLTDIAYGLQRSRFSRWIVRQALCAEHLIAISAYQARMLEARGTARPHIIPFGVGEMWLKPTEAVQRDPYLLINAGSVIPVKDQQLLLRALALLPTPFHAQIVGEGREQANLEMLAKALGIAKRVQFCGKAAHDDLPAFYRQAAIHVQTSRHEGEGMVTLEAAACGTPTVGTAVGILADDADLGIAVPVGDAAALAEAILEMQPQAAEYGGRARNAIEARYTLAQSADAIMSVYKRARSS